MSRVGVVTFPGSLDDRDAAASVVRAIDPDVLCLQEVPRRLGAAWRVSRFAGACGMAWVGRHRGSGGTTIFVSERIRVSGAGHHRLPVRLLDRTHGYAVAHLVIDGWQPLTAVSLHLSLRPEERQRHAGAILAALADQPGALVVAAGAAPHQGTDRPVPSGAGRFAGPWRWVPPRRNEPDAPGVERA